ncbi:hypothetical protein V1273_001790 [Bradyrhizobium sp. AZCC 1721]
MTRSRTGIGTATASVMSLIGWHFMGPAVVRSPYGSHSSLAEEQPSIAVLVSGGFVSSRFLTNLRCAVGRFGWSFGHWSSNRSLVVTGSTMRA